MRIAAVLIALICFQATAQPTRTPHLFQRYINERRIVLYEHPCGLPIEKVKYPWQGAIVFGGQNPPPVLFCYSIQGRTKQVVFSKDLAGVPPSLIDDFGDGGPITEVILLSLEKMIKENRAK